MITIILQASCYKESIKDRNFKHICGIPVISYIINRIKSVPEFELIVATSDRTEDNVLEELCNQEKIRLFRGTYDNVLDRLCTAANISGATDIVRIFSNYPLIDIEQLRKLYIKHIDGKYDYSYNEHNKGVLWGTGCEVFNVSFLNKLNKLNLHKSQRETISFYIRQNESKYKVYKDIICELRPNYKLYLETQKDLEVIGEIAEKVTDITNSKIIDYFSNHKILSKYNLEEPAKEVGLEKLFIHPEKIKSLISPAKIDMTYPISVEMTLTNSCNLKCVYCSDNELRIRQGKNNEIELSVIKKLFSDLSKGGTKGVVLEGGGEPTLYTGFSEIVNYAKQYGLALGLITNGTVRLNPEVIKEFEWIRVSLDASSALEYKELKGVDLFERVISNIAFYSEYCNTVGVGYVVTNKNITHIESLVMRLRELGASYIQLRPVVDCDELYPHNIDLTYLKFYQNNTFAVIVDGMKENASSGNHSLPCKAHSLTSIISGDGSVYLCGRLNVYSWLKPIGNINTQDFSEIWNSEERHRQSSMVSDAEFCKKNCPQCRISKFNSLISRLECINSRNFI